jgi:2-(1,2-epoxy-1,2-dihydrophenyl)acetyl-CoA isomerase
MNDIDATITGSELRITLRRPDRGNALSSPAAAELASTIDDVSLTKPEVRVIVIGSEGRQFCTGADLTPSADKPASKPINGHMVRSLADSHHRAIQVVFDCRVPTVAAVQGAAIGFGLHLALACDFVVAGAAATFREPFAQRGFSVDSGGSWLLPRLIGMHRAKRMLYLAEEIDAATAHEWGLVSHLAGDDDVESTAAALAVTLAAGPTQALAATKRLLHDSADGDLRAAMHAESMAVELTLRSRDFREGMKAMAERRDQDFSGQ